jgi:hypothetical protein
MIAIILLAFLIPIGIGILLYFLVVQKKLCDGDLHSCSGSNVKLCVKSGTSDDDWKGICTKLEKSSNFKQGLGMGPGNGQCVKPPPPKTSIKNITDCNRCINNDESYWNDNTKRTGCFDGYASQSKAISGDIVAFNYKSEANPKYSCNTPAEVC